MIYPPLTSTLPEEASTALPSYRPRNGSVVSSVYCMNDPNRRVTWQATLNDDNS
jgi:hypothetical protein